MNCEIRMNPIYLRKGTLPNSMFLSNILKRIREKGQRKTILKELINSLRIDETQRYLYLESLELLDDEGMTAFYHRLVAFVDETEGRQILAE